MKKRERAFVRSVLKYSEDQPRGADGRFGGGGSHPETHTATRDAVLDHGKGSSHDIRSGRYSVQLDQAPRSHVTILSAEKRPDGKVHGYARSDTTGQLFHYAQTGRAGGTKDQMTRVHLASAQDTGDLSGTLLFDHGDSEHSQGGYVNNGVLKG